ESTEGATASCSCGSEHPLAAGHVFQLFGGRFAAEGGATPRIAPEAPQHVDMGALVIEHALVAECREQAQPLLVDEQRFRMHVGHIDEEPAIRSDGGVMPPCNRL